MSQEHALRTTISLQEHPALIGMLNDEQFRQELETRPVDVLKRFGVHLRAEEVPHAVDLASPPKGKAAYVFAGLI